MPLNHWRYQIPLRLRSLFRRTQVEQELNEEFEHHLLLQTEANIAAGMDEKEAHYAALRHLNGMAQQKEQCRDQRKLAPWEGLRQDLRHAVRTLRRSPGFTLVAVMSLALGIGANGALFSVIDQVLLHPLALPDADRLVVIYEKKNGKDATSNPPRVADWQAQVTSFSAVGGSYGEGLVLTGRGTPERVAALRSCGRFFAVLGIQPPLGRTFTPSEERGEGSPVAILSHAFWKRRFDANPSIMGQSLALSGIGHTIIGVMPESLTYPSDVDIWIPMPAAVQDVNRGAGFLNGVARLKPGATLQQAQVELNTVARRLALQYPDTDGGLSARVTALSDDLVLEARTPLFILLGAAGVVLLIACVNLSSLLLGRAEVRRREAVVRVALGAGQARLIRLFLTESMIVALLGCALGLFVAYSSLDLLKSLLPGDLPNIEAVALNPRVIAFSTLLALFCGALTGIIPGWRAARAAVGTGLKEGGAATSGHRRSLLLPGLVIAEVTMSLVLLTGAALLARTFVSLSNQPLGFRPAQVLIVNIDFPWDTPGKKLDSFYQQALEKFAAIPGVQTVGLADRPPLGGGSQGSRMMLRNRPAPPGGDYDQISLRAASVNYFTAVGMPLLAGRLLSPNEHATMVNKAFVRKFLGDQNPIGREVTFNPPKANGKGPEPVWHEIVGVVGDVRQDPTKEVTAEAYILPSDTYWPMATFALRAQGDPSQLAAGVREAVSDIDPNQLIRRIVTLEDSVHAAYAQPRTRMNLLAGFAAVALLLAAIGIYGVLAQEVARRSQEFGLRMALGAKPSEVSSLALRRGLRLSLAGLALGIAGAFGLSRYLSSMLYGVPPTDPLAFIAAAAVLLLAAMLASYLPARRAARVDPIVALRHD